MSGQEGIKYFHLAGPSFGLYGKAIPICILIWRWAAASRAVLIMIQETEIRKLRSSVQCSVLVKMKREGWCSAGSIRL